MLLIYVKRIIVLYLILVLLLPLVQSVPEFYPNPNSSVRIAFISKYDSRSMDINTFNYFLQIKDKFSVYIIKDEWIERNTNDWQNTYPVSDGFFIMSLNDSMLKESGNNFCGNLRIVLNKTKGVAFAGNSLRVDNTLIENTSGLIGKWGFDEGSGSSAFDSSENGCIYDSTFNLALVKKNTELKNNNIVITNNHVVTSGYQKSAYNLGVKDSLHTVISPTNGNILAVSYGDPDGSNTGLRDDNYSALTVWEGLTYRVGAWSVNTSDLTNCSNCLGWNLLTNLLTWISNTSDMGFKVKTDKDTYAQEDRVNINVNSPVALMTISGQMIYPDGRKFSLIFTGSDKSWSSYYPLFNEDPTGGYTINVTSNNFVASKAIKVQPFDLIININNQTKQTVLNIISASKDGTIHNDVNTQILIITPSSQSRQFNYSSNGNVTIIYNTTEYGRFSVSVLAVDSLQRVVTFSKNFYFYPKVLSLSPTSVTRRPNKLMTLTETIDLTNREIATLTNIQVIKSGDISSWIVLDSTTIPNLNPSSSRTFSYRINIPNVADGNYTGSIRLSYDQGEVNLPILIRVENKSLLTLNITEIEIRADRSSIITEGVLIKNNLNTNITNVTVNKSGEIKDWIQLNNSNLGDVQVNGSKILQIRVVVPNVTDNEYTGSIIISYDQGMVEIPINIIIGLKKKLDINVTSITIDTQRNTIIEEGLLVTNNLGTTITNVTLNKGGEIQDWITLDNRSYPNLTSDNSTNFNFKIAVPNVVDGNYAGFVEITYSNKNIKIPISIQVKSQQKLENFAVNPSSVSVYTSIDKTKTVKLNLVNKGPEKIIIKSAQIKGELTNYATITNQPNEIEYGTDKELEIELNPKNIVVTDVSKLITGYLAIAAESPDGETSLTKTIQISFRVVANPTPKVEDLSNKINEAEKEILKIESDIDVSELKSEIQSTKQDTDDVKKLYEIGDYEGALNKITNIEKNIARIKSETENKRKEIGQNALNQRSNTIKNILDSIKATSKYIVILLAIGVIGIIVWIVYRKTKESKEYNWLYKKWGKK